jgi:hypothetical protein
MKLLIVKLLLPPTRSSALETGPSLGPDGPVTQASQARAELIVADKEEAAILVNVFDAPFGLAPRWIRGVCELGRWRCSWDRSQEWKTGCYS